MGLVPSLRARTRTQEKLSTTDLDETARKSLQVAMDEIIPAVNGMPSASDIGGVEYLDRLARQNSEMRSDLLKSLAALEKASQRLYRTGFSSLGRRERIESLKKLENGANPEHFAHLRDFVYESYYTQPKIWKLIGYDHYSTDQSGPRMKPFDESVLSAVKKKPKLYREVT